MSNMERLLLDIDGYPRAADHISVIFSEAPLTFVGFWGCFK